MGNFATTGELNAHRLASAWRFALASARRCKDPALTAERLHSFARVAWPVAFPFDRLDAERLTLDAISMAGVATR
ncbi:hypothetical protein [Fulvimonas yonginensis]|uniref:Uncharacterized protein n=1 Tax=Fulvimonas yonginensis TaxID=1495200 RepID=A0ABU8JG12_9GAMM